MKMSNKEGKAIVNVSEVERKGDDLLVRSKIAGLMPMTLYMKPEEMWEAVQILNWQLIRYMPVFIVKGWYRHRKLSGKRSRFICFFEDCGNRMKSFSEKHSGSK